MVLFASDIESIGGFIVGGLAIVFIFGGWVMVAIARTFAENRRLASQHEQLAVLKKEMLDRGMSAADIERVISAGMAPAQPVEKA